MVSEVTAASCGGSVPAIPVMPKSSTIGSPPEHVTPAQGRRHGSEPWSHPERPAEAQLDAVIEARTLYIGAERAGGGGRGGGKGGGGGVGQVCPRLEPVVVTIPGVPNLPGRAPHSPALLRSSNLLRAVRAVQEGGMVPVRAL